MSGILYIGSRIERRVNENSCGKVNGEERRGEGSRDPSSAASEAESSGKEGKGGSQAPSLPMARSADKGINVNSNVENDLREEIFVEKLKEYADTLQQSEGPVMKKNADLSSASGLIPKVSHVPTGTKGCLLYTSDAADE